MKLSHAIAKVAQPLTYRRAWRRVRRIAHPIPLAPLLAHIDRDRLRTLQAQYGLLPQDAPGLWRHYSKYLEIEKRLKLNIERAQDLNLQRLPPQEILDLGCGGGFFLYVVQSLGHHGLGLDVPGIPLFDELVQLLAVARIDHRITMFQPLPELGRKFDLITAFATAFQGGREDEWRWGPREWDFLITDLKSLLKPRGRLFFDLNATYQERYYTPEILAVFRQRDAIVERGKVTIL